MATIQPNFNPASIQAQLASATGGTASQQAALVASTNFSSVASSIEFSQQMLATLTLLQSSWMGIGGGGLIGDGSTASLGAPLSGQYSALTFGSPGSAGDLNSLQTNLRGAYAGMLPGMTDDLTKISPPLSSAYAQLMASGAMPGLSVPGMPLAKPIQLGEVSTPQSILASMPKTPPKAK